jgi:hypothetical protein
LSLGVSTENTTTSSGDYVDASLQMNTSVGYISSPTGSYSLSSTKNFNSPFSTNPANSTNVKYISTTITSGAHDGILDTNITLKAFMCNIGTYDLKRRTF